MNLKEKGSASKRKLLKAAEVCFAKRGFDVTSVDAVCRHVGLSKGGFYHHFSSKQELLLELLNQWLEKIDSYIESVQNSSEDTQELFTNIAGRARPVFIEAGSQLPLFLELWIKSSKDPELRKKTFIFYKKYLSIFKEIVDEGIRKGFIRKVNPEIVSRIILAVAVGLMMQGLLDPKGTDWDEVAGESSKILLHGLAKQQTIT